MPSEHFANRIRESLALGELYEDFAYLFDELVSIRRPYHENAEASKDMVGWLTCLFAPYKPAPYLAAMQRFRMGFQGVSTSHERQAEFSNCVRNAAIMVRQPDDIVWRPSLYFSLPERLTGLEEWF